MSRESLEEINIYKYLFLLLTFVIINSDEDKVFLHLLIQRSKVYQ